MAHGTVPTDTEQERRAASTARRVRVAVAMAIVGVAVAATAATVLVLGVPGERSAPDPRADRAAAQAPVRLDGWRPGKDERDAADEVVGSGEATRVIGVGTSRFGARSGGSEAVLDVDGRSSEPTNEVASDTEVRRQLAALERENARIEAALRGLGGSGIGTGELIWPVRGPLNSPFGQRWGRLHAGIDIGVGTGTRVRAADAGRVVISGWQGGYGNYICIQHTRRLTTCYAHNSRLGVRRGDRVRKGAVIAASGSTGNSTGPHVHFETRLNGTPVNPLRFL